MVRSLPPRLPLHVSVAGRISAQMLSALQLSKALMETSAKHLWPCLKEIFKILPFQSVKVRKVFIKHMGALILPAPLFV